MILYLLSLIAIGNKPDIELIKETHEREIAARASVRIKAPIDEKTFKRCIPRESLPFPASLPENLASSIFQKSELGDLMKCSVANCAFNFVEPERKLLEAAESPESKKALYWKFYNDRKEKKRAIETHEFWIRSDHVGLTQCLTNETKALLDHRPMANGIWRLSHVRYSGKMRPTTRLIQGIASQDGPIFCYAEALLFSDHYDKDRIEVWSWRPDEKRSVLQVEVRHRIDLLSTWVRRLNKQSFRDELKRVLTKQIEDARKCMDD